MSTEAELLSDIDPVLLRRRESNASKATAPLWIYCAGPMRGISEFNFPAFEAATKQLRSRGYKVISPAEQDLGRGFDPRGLTGHEDLSSLGFDLREALIADLNHIAYECDAICLLPGWESSKGANVELALAEALGLKVGTLDDFVADTAEPMSEREYLTGAEKDRDARLDRLAAWSASNAELGRLRVHYPTGTFPQAEPCLSLVRELWPPERLPQVRSAWLDTDVLPLKHDEIRVTSSTGGQKGKKLAQYDLIPTRPLRAVAELYGYGASKYKKARNWEKGYDWSLSYAALQRHANLFWSREDNDAETGLPHLAAVVFHALALMEYRTTHPEFDDRPTGKEVRT